MYNIRISTSINTLYLHFILHITVSTQNSRKTPRSEMAKRQLSCRRPFRTHVYSNMCLIRIRRHILGEGRVKQGFPFSNIEPCVFAVGMMSPTPTCGICQVQRCHLTFEIVQLLSFMFCIYLKGLLVTSCYPWWKYIEQWNLSCMGLFAAVCYWVQGKHKYKYNTNNNINSNNSNSNTNSNTQIQTQTQTQTQMVCRYVLPGSEGAAAQIKGRSFQQPTFQPNALMISWWYQLLLSVATNTNDKYIANTNSIHIHYTNTSSGIVYKLLLNSPFICWNLL